MTGSLVVDFPRPVAAVFGYLAEPRNRPQWQSSLRRVEDVVGHGETGTTWRDVTVVGARPRLRVVRHEAGRAWSEVGEWGGIHATLDLRFEPAGEATRVRCDVAVTTSRLTRRPLVVVLSLLAPRAVRADLRRAARHVR